MVNYIILGGGSAGCVLASRLSENPKTRVLLIEGGGADAQGEIRVTLGRLKLFESEVDWDYTTTPQPTIGTLDEATFAASLRPYRLEEEWPTPTWPRSCLSLRAA
jgi:choline dehydrogenase-like flavoprotein